MVVLILSEYLPGLQTPVQLKIEVDATPSVVEMFTGQGTQVDSDNARTAEEYFPAVQDVHTL